jgi:uncharacterized membrane protein YhiD involved in acid resistance
MIKDKFVEEFSSDLGVGDVFLTLLCAFLLGLFVMWIYKLTYQGVLISKSFCLGLVLLSMITSVIIMTVVSNLALSLGMVGALSIVRFRTAVKDSTDTLFMFWAIAAGIMSGAGLRLIALVSTVLLGVLYIVCVIIGARLSKHPYLLVIRYSDAEKVTVESALKNLPNTKVKSRTLSSGVIELCLEIRLDSSSLKKVDVLAKIPGVLDVSAVSYNADTML